MANRFAIATMCLFAISLTLIGGVAAAEKLQPGEKRARPPNWSKEVLDVFFEDANAKLVGTRPDYGQAPVASNDTPAGTEVKGVDVGAAWSKLIDAETIETEIKRLNQALVREVTTPTAFKGGGYEDCRRDFSVLAALFAIAAEYDGEVRWQDSAAGLREVFARAGRNCKVGNDQTYRDAAQRKQDLADLVAGSRPKLPSAEKAAAWGEVADLAPLMQRLGAAHEERLTKWLANPREFEQHQDEVRHEAQIVAAIADVIGREGFDYWDEEDYARNARELREAANEAAAAVDLDDYEQAQKAINRATKACAACHELYRG
jgi:hypothetical protein